MARAVHQNPERETTRLWRATHPGVVISNNAAPFQAKIDQQWSSLKAAVNSKDAGIITGEQTKADALFSEIQASGLSVDEKGYLAAYFSDSILGPKDALSGNYNNPVRRKKNPQELSNQYYWELRAQKDKAVRLSRVDPGSDEIERAESHTRLILHDVFTDPRLSDEEKRELDREFGFPDKNYRNPIRYTINGEIPDDMLRAQQDFSQRSVAVIGAGLLALVGVWVWDRMKKNV